MTAVRIRSLAPCLPGNPVSLDALDPEGAKRRRRLGQEIAHVSDGRSSTDLMVDAARALAAADPEGISRATQIISAPSLIPAFGFDIPSVAVADALDLGDAECLNLAQGCVGLLRGLDLARLRLRADPESGDVLIVTGCVASTITDRLSHGAYYWGDGALAVIVTAEPGPGFHVEAYAEKSSRAHFDAMRVPFGDSRPADQWRTPEDLRIVADLPDAAAIDAYLKGETVRFTHVLTGLAAAAGAAPTDVAAIGLPAFGKNRLPVLFAELADLEERVVTDFRYGHMGGIDPLLFAERHRAGGHLKDGDLVVLMTAAFMAQWAGILLCYRERA